MYCKFIKGYPLIIPYPLRIGSCLSYSLLFFAMPLSRSLTSSAIVGDLRFPSACARFATEPNYVARKSPINCQLHFYAILGFDVSVLAASFQFEMWHEASLREQWDLSPFDSPHKRHLTSHEWLPQSGSIWAKPGYELPIEVKYMAYSRFHFAKPWVGKLF